jgi:hypothetical protein
MGVYFEPPRRQAKKQWSVMQLLAENGYRFQTEGSKAYIDHFLLCSKNSSLKEVQNRIKVEKQEIESNRNKSKSKESKEEKRLRHL